MRSAEPQALTTKTPRPDRYRVPDDAHSELVNWSHWCWLGDWPCEAAYSAGFIGGRPIDPDDDGEHVAGPPPNHTHAQWVQAAWESLDTLTRKVLRAEYPARDGAGRAAAAHALGLTLDGYETLLRAGADRVMRQLEQHVAET